MIFGICHFRSEHSNAAKGESAVTDLENEIAENDMLRRSFEGGCVEISHDVASSDIIESILDGVRNYDSFAEHKNEQDEHAARAEGSAEKVKLLTSF